MLAGRRKSLYKNLFIVTKEQIIIVWYKRDLRVSDHKPLTRACELSQEMGIPVIGIFAFEPRIVSAPDFSDFHRQFIEDSLVDLSMSLQNIGIPLIIFERNISDVMKYIQTHYQIYHIFSHEEMGNTITYERDILMAKYLKAKNIPWTEYPTNGVVRRLKSRDTWSKIWKKRMMAPILPPPEYLGSFHCILCSDNWQRNIQNPHIQK